MKCPHCQAENREGRRFCSKCGRPFQIICPSCQAANEPGEDYCGACGHSLVQPAPQAAPAETTAPAIPTSFANGRYVVRKFLGEGGKKKVYLAHDTALDRDVAFALIKTEKLDESARTRIKREAQAMGKLGDHPNIVSIFDIGDHEGQPYIVIPFMAGGDVEGLIKKAPDHKLPLDKSIEIAKCVCRGLEFAHAKRIIHRDIKPGNVWLNAEGAAQIGDFGLAVAVDMSRLTQAGMMVGTVSYMPPEQAMGGNVTAKADLYSFGAMLYEMVTGRPPFVGDDSVAIVGQHINTPPVSPSWHRADLPPALETLIMQLLEKDPEKRPASAAVVLQALESIQAGKVKEPTKEAAAPAENPLYRRVFVGREQELRQLQSAFDGAMSGHGALMMVLGEPGIGKTALCEQLATYVTLRGGRTLVGHCYEEGSLSLPYLAFVEAMRSYVIDREVEDLRKDLGSGASDVARIVSEVREKLDVRPRTTGNPEEDRYRLLQGVSSFLTNAATIKPLLVVLEDLHDADKGTLEMLTYLSRNLSGARLLLLGTYRDVEVDRTHPLSAALAELRRVSTFGRVLLRGLNADEVRRMLEGITRESVPWSLAEAVHRQTEGNPLFVQEVVRFMFEEGLVTRKEGRWSVAKDVPLEMSIPEGLRDVIGKRLSLLSKDCNEMLSVASVVGREFAIETLRAVAGVSEETFVNALKEAVRLSVLEERSQVGQVRYRFTHAFFRQTLYEEMIAPQRLQRHQWVARALETQYASRLEEHAAELAEHFSQSTDRSDLAKAISYAEMAARRAEDVYAYGEAARLLDQAIKVQRVLNRDDKAKLCDLILGLAEALLEVPNTRRIIDSEAPAAFSIAESLGDNTRAVKASMIAVSAILYEQANPGSATPEFAMWAERADKYASPGTAGRAQADLAMSMVKSNSGQRKQGRTMLKQSMDLSRQLGDQGTLSRAGLQFIFMYTAPQHLKTNLSLAEELWEIARLGQGVKGMQLDLVAMSVSNTFMMCAQRQRAEEVLSRLRASSEVTRNPRFRIVSDGEDAVLKVMDGHLEDALTLTRDILARGAQIGTTGFSGAFAGVVQRRVEAYLGKPLSLPVGATAGGTQEGVTLSVFASLNCLDDGYNGRNREAYELLQKHVIDRQGFGSDDDETPTFVDVLFLEAAIIVEHTKAVDLLLSRLKDAEACTTGGMLPTCVARHLGGGAALLGRHDEARQHYQEAVGVCTKMKFRPELALTRLQLAELLLDHYPAEKKEALEHLDFAIKEFREMKMQPSLERALRHKGILKA